MDDYVIKARWPAAHNVHALFTTRFGGYSRYPYGLHSIANDQQTDITTTGGLNLGRHVGDDLASVLKNRQQLQQTIGQDIEIIWLNQAHGTAIYDADLKVVFNDFQHPVIRAAEPASPLITADAIISSSKHIACAILTADCLPILIADRYGRAVAAIHAGWRGLANGIIEKTIIALTLKALKELALSSPLQLTAMLGPAISADYFEVGKEVKYAFIDASRSIVQGLKTNEIEEKICAEKHRLASRSQPYLYSNPDLFLLQTAAAFKPSTKRNYFYCDLIALARQRLKLFNIKWVGGGIHCTYRQPNYFYSYRRDGITGRMASLIWLR